MPDTDREIAVERLLANREILSTGCWGWTRSCSGGSSPRRRYGQTSYRGQIIYVHRLAAHLWLGFDLSSKLCVLHRCDTTTCFNPEHLFVGTPADNTADMMAKGRNRYVLPKRIAGDVRTSICAALRGGLGVRETARVFGVSHTAVMAIRDEG